MFVQSCGCKNTNRWRLVREHQNDVTAGVDSWSWADRWIMSDCHLIVVEVTRWHVRKSSVFSEAITELCAMPASVICVSVIMKWCLVNSCLCLFQFYCTVWYLLSLTIHCGCHCSPCCIPVDVPVPELLWKWPLYYFYICFLCCFIHVYVWVLCYLFVCICLLVFCWSKVSFSAHEQCLCSQ